MQFVTRVRVVIEKDERPLAAHVAGIAGAAEMTVVIVVLDVAGHTTGFELVRERILAVAVAAIELPVAAVQYKQCVARVVEARIVPADRAVAILTLLAALAVMDVVIGVAARTRRWCVLEGLVFVTAETRGIQMLAD